MRARCDSAIHTLSPVGGARCCAGNKRSSSTFIRHSGNLLGTMYFPPGKASCGNAHTMEAVMKIRHCLLGATAAIGLAVVAASAEAAPAVATAGDLTAVAREASNVDQVYWSRRCWRQRRHLHCQRRWVDYGYAPYYYYHSPSYYRPSFGFFIGGHRHHHHFRRW